jgi:hypothetical protein
MRSRRVRIFVACKDSVSEFIQQIEPVLGFQMTSNEGNVLGLRATRELLYVYSDSKNHYGLSIRRQNYLINDDDLNFEDYDYEIRCYAEEIENNLSEELRIADEFARIIFNRLKSMNQFRLMLVDDIDEKLDEFYPKSNNG